MSAISIKAVCIQLGPLVKCNIVTLQGQKIGEHVESDDSSTISHGHSCRGAHFEKVLNEDGCYMQLAAQFVVQFAAQATTA
jgi:hypothetical protein